MTVFRFPISDFRLPPPLLSYKEDGRYLAQVGHAGTFPVADSLGAYPFVWSGDAGCYAHAGVGAQGGTHGVEHLAVAIGSLDEQL